MSWLDYLYEAFGTRFPIISYVVIFLFFGSLAAGAWWLVGHHYKIAQSARRQPMRDVRADENSPVNISSYGHDGNYPPGTELGAIPWQAHYVDVRLDIKNKGSTAAESINFYVQLDTTIAAAGQFTDVPDVFIEAVGDFPSVWLEGGDENDMDTAFPIVPGSQFGSPVYRIFCSRLLANSTMRLVLASMALNPTEEGKLPEKLFAPKRKPLWLRVRGVYEMPSENPPRRLHVDVVISFDRK